MSGFTASLTAFVRAQMANGVSAETLRIGLKIRAEHMAEVLATVAIEPPPPPRPPPAPVTTARIAMPPPSHGLSKDALVRRAEDDRATAGRLARLVVPVVAALTGCDRQRIESACKMLPTLQVRAMVFALMHEMAPACPLIAIGWAVGGRQAAAVERALARCQRMRAISREYDGWYATARVRLAP